MSLLDYLTPVRCPLCDRERCGGDGEGCPDCIAPLLSRPLPAEGRCSICHSSLVEGLCSHCGSRPLFFDVHRSIFGLDRDWHRLFLRWKFGNQRSLYRLFMPYLATLFRDLPATPGRIGFIDSGRGLYDRRAYQPCADLARSLGKLHNIPVAGDVRKRHRGSQSSRGYAERFFEVRHSFELKRRKRLFGLDSYLLVEDLYTTGATANEASRLLKEAGVSRVFVISMLKHDVIEAV